MGPFGSDSAPMPRTLQMGQNNCPVAAVCASFFVRKSILMGLIFKENKCMARINPDDNPVIRAPAAHMSDDASFNLVDAVAHQNFANTADEDALAVHLLREPRWKVDANQLGVLHGEQLWRCVCARRLAATSTRAPCTAHIAAATFETQVRHRTRLAGHDTQLVTRYGGQTVMRTFNTLRTHLAQILMLW